MAERYAHRILDHLSHRRYEPRTVRELADDLSIPDDEFDDFRKAVESLLDENRVVLGAAEQVILPPPGREMTGIFRKHERGFGFLIPDELTQHGDLFIPPGQTLDALTGDRVRAKVSRESRRAGGDRSPYTGAIVEILQRADKQYVGTLSQRGKQYVVIVDGRTLHEPVLVRDPHAKDAKPGDKVVIELIDYPDPDQPGQLAEGVIVERLGDAGEPEVETLSIIRAYGLDDKFEEEVVENAREAARSFSDKDIPADREDLTDTFICTIDPPDARDFDDAISIRRLENEGDAAWELGIHIADVSHFIKPGSPLDVEAYNRGNSTYLPRKVLPMLPELLSNGVCSLQEGVNRFTKSAFIRYDDAGNVVGERFSRSVIRSAKRLTYLEAQALIDGDLREAVKHARSEPKYPKQLVQTLKMMDELAKTIRERRLKDGMIVLGLPVVQLVFDDAGRVADAVPEDNAFTHTIIEMFMVEANEAAARLFDRLSVPMIRRVHPDPDAHDVGALRQFAHVAGYNIPAKPSRKELQSLLDQVRGKPAQHAVHLAVLKTLSKAEYAPVPVGHFALASEHYTHFTSPIRRYPDLIIHRGLDAWIDASSDGEGGRKKKQIAKAMRDDPRVPDEDRLREIGRHCSNTERNSESAERELRDYLVLELLSEHMGEDFDGTVTGVTAAGAYLQLDRYLVDGLIRANELPGGQQERWKFNAQAGNLVAQRSGKTLSIGDRFVVRVANVDLTKRQLDLTIIAQHQGGEVRPVKKAGGTPKKHREQPPGAKKAHQNTQRIKQSKGKGQGQGKKTAPDRKGGRKKRGRR